MGRLVFLLEEASMAAFLREVLPKIEPDWRENEHWLFIHHRGKKDLEKSIPIKLRAWNESNDCFIIVRDNDGADCHVVKAKLLGVATSKPTERVRVRLVCQHLEGWFLGDLDALSAAYPHVKVSERRLSAKYRDPDVLTNACQEVERLTKEKGKVGRAKKVGAHIAPEKNRSHSFKVFVSGVKQMKVQLAVTSRL